MADQGAHGPAATVAAPAPARLPPSPAGQVSEAEFWANDTAPAIGGPYGIPNGMMAAAAAAGSPDDVGTLFGRLDGRRGRGLAMQLQRSMGNRYAASLLGRGPVVQRQNGAGGGKSGYNYNGIDVSADRAANTQHLLRRLRSIVVTR